MMGGVQAPPALLPKADEPKPKNGAVVEAKQVAKDESGPKPPEPDPVAQAKALIEADRSRRLALASSELEALQNRHRVALNPYVVSQQAPDGSIVCSASLRLVALQ